MASVAPAANWARSKSEGAAHILPGKFYYCKRLCTRLWQLHKKLLCFSVDALEQKEGT